MTFRSCVVESLGVDLKNALTLAFIGALVLLSSVGWASSTEMPLTVCGHCQSDASYASAAEQVAPNWAPGNGDVVVHPVYVIKPDSGEIRYFDVHVWYDWGDMNPHSDSGTNDVQKSLERMILQAGLQKLAIAAEGEPESILALEQAHGAVMSFVASISGDIDSTDLDNAPDSAIDLFGPLDGQAGQLRDNLISSLQSYFDSLWGQALMGLGDLAKRSSGRLIGSGGFLNPLSLFRVNFPDGTAVIVRVTNVSTAFASILVEFEIPDGYGRLPDEQSIPYTAGRFENFEFGGNHSAMDSLIELADRFGIDVSDYGAGGCGNVFFYYLDDQHMVVECVRD